MYDHEIDYFPAKLAIGAAFCNRVSELKQMHSNIAKSRHTVIYSPRRYGKSSLVNKVVIDLNLPCATIDLFLAHDDNVIIKRIMSGIGEILSHLLTPSQKFLRLAQQLFHNFRVTLGIKGYYVEATFGASTADVIDKIYEALNIVNKLAVEKKRKIVIFFDEFQDIANANGAKSIQGAIRNIAQSTDNIVFIFSGSYQHMLAELFDDKAKPLYMLCDKIYLERIYAKDYKEHINKIAYIKWKKHLKPDVLDKILDLTEAHAFYVNMLCDIIFAGNCLPDLDSVLKAWEKCQDIEQRRIISDIENLAKNQQDVLRLIAIYSPTEPTGAQFVKSVGKASSTIRQCVMTLLQKDFVYLVNRDDTELTFVKKGQYRVLDPLLSKVLRELS